MKPYHIPVLVDEVINGLNVRKGEKYIDATIGGGGHSFEILQRGGMVLGIDRDQEALDYIESRITNQELRVEEGNLKLVQGDFSDIAKIARENGFEKVAGILFDLGVSSHQLDAARGFSFRREEPLDMRMNQKAELTAHDLVNELSGEELAEIFLKYGEEKNATPIAWAIVAQRKKKHIATTGDLAHIIESVNTRQGMIHPATKIFQALRIVVNEELTEIQKGIEEGFEILSEKGRMAVISFHSLEDRIVKNAFRNFAQENRGEIITKKPIIATDTEIQKNPRSRSAKLRIFEKN